MNRIKKYHNKFYFIFDICFVLIAAITFSWQWIIDDVNPHLFGLLFPLFITLKSRLSREDDTLTKVALFMILIQLSGLSLSFSALESNITLIIIFLGICLFSEPTINFISGSIYTFWIVFFFHFVTSSAMELLTFSNFFTYTTQISFIHFVQDLMYLVYFEHWWIIAITGFIFMVSSLLIEGKKRTDEYFQYGMTVFSIGILLVPLVMIGIAFGIYGSIKVYLTCLNKNIRFKKSNYSYEKYLYWKAFTDFRLIIKNYFSSNNNVSKAVSKISRMQRRHGITIALFPSIILFIEGLTALVGGTFLFFGFAFIHLIGLIVLSILFFLLLLTIKFIDRMLSIGTSSTHVCPSCHEHCDLPLYQCPTCCKKHNAMRPGKYGIFKRKCACKTKLPTTFFNGRKELDAYCPKCGVKTHSKEATPYCIPVIGPPSIGKTSFVYATTKVLLEETAPRNNWNVDLKGSLEEKKEINRIIQNLKLGYPPKKSIKTIIKAFTIYISHKKWFRNKMLYLYDPAGAWYLEDFDMNTLKFLQRADGNIFIIDPFSIPKIQEKYTQQLHSNFNAINPSIVKFEDVFDRLLLKYQEKMAIKAHEKIVTPLAIVINKVDALRLNNNFSEETIKKVLSSNPKIKNEEEAIHELCKRFLTEHGLGNFLRKVDSKYTNYRFFICSSLKGINTERPLKWLLKSIRRKTTNVS